MRYCLDRNRMNLRICVRSLPCVLLGVRIQTYIALEPALYLFWLIIFSRIRPYTIQDTELGFITKLNPISAGILVLIRETEDKIVASLVDVCSIFLAYQIGLSQLGIVAGLGYGMFDAWIVVWQRERISNIIHRASDFVRRYGPFRRKDILPWVPESRNQT